MTFPLSLETLFTKPGMYLIFAVIGFAFGYVLEISGFGDSRKLAAQFYFKELTVLKVMFSAIVVAMVLIFAAVGFGILDYNGIWVNPTYLWSGILGGLIMGVGFIVGGFCPGTSLVSAATFKLDGVFFVLGVLTGIFFFGETVGLYEDFWNGSYYGRLTIMDWLNLPNGVVVTIIMFMALFMFWGGEQLERIFGKRELAKEPKWRIAWGGVLALSAVAVIFIGQPTTADKWQKVAFTKGAALTTREVQIHPGELLNSLADNTIKTVVLDVRSEADYNLFHIKGARLVDPQQLTELAKELLVETAGTKVYVITSNDEAAATEAWKFLVAESVPNVYILEGGINNWISIFGEEDPQIAATPAPPGDKEALRYTFPAALGSRYEAADPDPHDWTLEYTPKIKLEAKRDKSGGGCG